jgi:DNA-binding transcriptional LysR family regulator
MPTTPPTLDHLQLFVRVAEEGGFTAAARRDGRTQSAVSYAISSLEELLGTQLFSRNGRTALTPAGSALLADARQVLSRLDQLRAHADRLAEGVETTLGLAIETMFPQQLLVAALHAFHGAFPTVQLRIHPASNGDVAASVRSGATDIGIGTADDDDDDHELQRSYLAQIGLVPVAAPNHRLARVDGPITGTSARASTEVVLSERCELPTELAGRTWCVADAPTMLSLIRGGLGWGALPFDMVRDALDDGSLVRLELLEWGPKPKLVPLYAIVRADSAPGRAASWLLQRLEQLCQAP